MGKARRKFTKQYKADAVQLYQDSGLTMGQVAQQLGIGESTLQLGEECQGRGGCGGWRDAVDPGGEEAHS